jgi:hypothetical protein
MSDKKKAELLNMLAEAVRNTQPQPPSGTTQRDAQPKRKRKTRPVSKRTRKT